MDTLKESFVTLFFGVFIIAFASLLPIGIYHLYQHIILAQQGIKATGEVVNFEARSDSDGGYMYYPIVEFELSTGRLYKAKLPNAAYPAPYDLGEQVEVVYFPDQPETAIPYTITWMYFNPFLGIVIGGAFMYVLWTILQDYYHDYKARRRPKQMDILDN